MTFLVNLLDMSLTWLPMEEADRGTAKFKQVPGQSWLSNRMGL
jgi:hypothetical protein